MITASLFHVSASTNEPLKNRRLNIENLKARFGGPFFMG